MDPQRGLAGQQISGHGALTLALNHPDLFRSVSAFAPICSPTRCAWGEKAFTAYLGDDRTAWDRHDAAKLIAGGAAKGVFDDVLIDQGDADSFLTDQLTAADNVASVKTSLVIRCAKDEPGVPFDLVEAR